MAGNAALLTEDDGDELDQGTGGGPATNDGQQPGGEQPSGLKPLTTPPINRAGRQQAEEPQFEPIEVDDEGNEVGGQQQPSTGEQRLGQSEEQQEGRQPRESLRAKIDREEEEARGLGISRSALRRSKKNQNYRNLQNENTQLRGRLDQLESQVNDFRGRVEPRLNEFDQGRAQAQVQAFDNEIATANTELKAAQDLIRKALTDNDPDAFTAAEDRKDAALIKRVRAEANKNALEARLRQGQEANVEGADPNARARGANGADRGGNGQARQSQQAQEIVLAPTGLRYRDEFMRSHDWIDGKSTDPEVRRLTNRVRFLDAEVASEGYDPNTTEYWRELNARMQEVMPEVFDDDGETQEQRQQPRQNGSRQNGASARAGGGNGAAANGGGGTGNGTSRQAAVPPQRRGPMVTGASGRPANAAGKIQVAITPLRKAAMIASGSVAENGDVLDRAKFDRQVAYYAKADADRASGTGQ